MEIIWNDGVNSGWVNDDDRQKFIDSFESEYWTSFYEILKTQVEVTNFAVNIRTKLTGDFFVRVDFSRGSIFIYPWLCVHSQGEVIGERNQNGSNDAPWLIGNFNFD